MNILSVPAEQFVLFFFMSLVNGDALREGNGDIREGYLERILFKIDIRLFMDPLSMGLPSTGYLLWIFIRQETF